MGKLTNREAYIAFNLTDRIGSATLAKMALQHGSVSEAWEMCPHKVSRAGGEVDWRREIALAERHQVKLVTPADEEYPQSLKFQSVHPLVLYVRGDVKALANPSIALVGTRRATAYGLDNAYSIAKGLAESGWTVVSGLALGIDAEAHRGALAAGGVTVGVIGSGLDRFYPEQNVALAREIVEKGGAVVSEFPFGRPPDEHTFPQRNHTVAALSRGVVAIEAPLKSGTLITTSIAAEIGRTVMALPGRIDSRSSAGCLKLIREGARLVRNARDVEEEMSELLPRTQPKNAVPAPETAAALSSRTPFPQSEEGAPVPRFSLEEGMIMKHVDTEGVFIDALVEKTGLPAGKVNSLCMTLRLKGRVRFLPGNRVALPREV